jgi:hypothetical protein
MSVEGGAQQIVAVVLVSNGNLPWFGLVLRDGSVFRTRTNSHRALRLCRYGKEKEYAQQENSRSHYSASVKWPTRFKVKQLF